MATNIQAGGDIEKSSIKDNIPSFVELAQASNTQGQPAMIPGIPDGEVHLTIPANQKILQVLVAPGETINLPFEGAMAAKFGDQGNLAIKVGDQTIILLGYAQANQQEGVTVDDAHGHPIDIAAVVAQTDPNLDIVTAAGPAGPVGPGGHLFLGFHPGSGLDGLGELGVINPTELQYKLIQPDESILPMGNRLGSEEGTPPTPPGGHELTIGSTDGGVNSLIEILSFNNQLEGETTFVTTVLDKTHEGHALPPGVADGVDPANLTMNVASDVTVTLEHNQAKDHNLVGIYEYDANGKVIDGSVKFVWLDATLVNQAVNQTDPTSLLVDDFLGHKQSLTVDIGHIDAGTKLGFFLVDGNTTTNLTAYNHDIAAIKAAAGNGSDLSELNSKTTIEIDQNGLGHVVVAGTQLESETYFTSNPNWNGDQKEHSGSGINNPADGLLYIGFEDRDLNTKGLQASDKDFNDVVFAVNLGNGNLSNFQQFLFQPQAQLADPVNDIDQMTIVTSGFLLGDQLNHLTSANGFDVNVVKNGNDYNVTITETTAHATAEWQSFVNNISFSTKSTTDGDRQLTYTVHDSAGHSATTTATVDVVSVHRESLSTETEANHPGTALLHSGTTDGHDVAWGNGNDILYFDQGFTKAAAVVKDGILDMGSGVDPQHEDFDTVHLARNNIGFTSDDAGHVKNVEHIDSTGYGKNLITLSAADIISMTGADHTLRFDGDTANTDFVKLSGDGAGPGHWTQIANTTIGSVTYNQYQWHTDATNSAASVGAVVQVNENLHHALSN